MGSSTPRNSDSATSDTDTPKKKSRSNKIVPPACRFVEKVRLRLVSEMHRLLMCHSEHAMTLTELCEEFRKTDDPACPSEQDLHACASKIIYSEKPKSGHHSLVVSVFLLSVLIHSLSLSLLPLPFPPSSGKWRKSGNGNNITAGTRCFVETSERPNVFVHIPSMPRLHNDKR